MGKILLLFSFFTLQVSHIKPKLPFMTVDHRVLKKITPVLVYGRPPLVFGGMLCAMAVMLTRSSSLYLAGTLLLFTSMIFDLVDGWFAARFITNLTIAELAERIMDRLVYSIVFPLVAVGMMWRLVYAPAGHNRLDLLHAVFVLIVCVTVLIRNNFAHFMRGFAIRNDQAPELRELTRLRTVIAAPLGLLLYMHAFYIPSAGAFSPIYAALDWMGNLPVRNLFIIEIVFLVINFGSIAGYCRKYGTYCLNEICLDDQLLRRRILAFFPNALTVMNAMMGLMAVFFAYQGKMTEAYLLLIGATVFDKLDGAMARRLGLTEPLPDTVKHGHVTFGGIMDDVADGMSFCIAPAWIFYICLSMHPDPDVRALPVALAAVTYVFAGFARLIYFTMDRSPIPGFFKGMPTPAAALFVTSPLLVVCGADAAMGDWGRFIGFFAFGLVLFTAFLMNLYPVRYLHMGRFMDRNPWFTWVNLLLMLVFVFTPFFGYLVFTQMLMYVLSPLFTWKVDPETAARETRGK